MNQSIWTLKNEKQWYFQWYFLFRKMFRKISLWMFSDRRDFWTRIFWRKNVFCLKKVVNERKKKVVVITVCNKWLFTIFKIVKIKKNEKRSIHQVLSHHLSPFHAQSTSVRDNSYLGNNFALQKPCNNLCMPSQDSNYALEGVLTIKS